MTVDQVIKDTLEGIPGLSGRAYPLEARKAISAPFAVYAMAGEKEAKALDGPTGLRTASYKILTTAHSYAELVSLDVESAFSGMDGTDHNGLLIERVEAYQDAPDAIAWAEGLYRRLYTLEINYQEERS